MPDHDTYPKLVLDQIGACLTTARAAYNKDDYREVMFQLDQIRERCSWIEKMMWRRLHPMPTGDHPSEA